MLFHSLINIRKEVATVPSFLKYIFLIHFSNCTKPLSYFKYSKFCLPSRQNVYLNSSPAYQHHHFQQFCQSMASLAQNVTEKSH